MSDDLAQLPVRICVNKNDFILFFNLNTFADAKRRLLPARSTVVPVLAVVLAVVPAAAAHKASVPPACRRTFWVVCPFNVLHRRRPNNARPAMRVVSRRRVRIFAVVRPHNCSVQMAAHHGQIRVCFLFPIFLGINTR
jgi:hypothetical protein